MKSNFHTHTKHCRHAGGLPEDYISEAVKKGLEILGMSDHAPFENIDYGYRMPFSELDIYCEEVDQAASRHAGEIKVLKSLEIEWLPEHTKDFRGKNYYEWLLTEKKMDYLLLGEHFYNDSNGHFHNITAIENTQLAVEYAKACSEAMSTGYFKILAHPDLFCINEPFAWNDDYERTSDMIIESAMKTGVILEYNANGLRRGKKAYPDGERFQYPHLRFWEKVRDAGLPAIVGSDCHSVDVLWDKAVTDAIHHLEDLNIKRLENI